MEKTIFDFVLVMFAGLAGFPAFVTVLVNVLKEFGIVKDGDAPKWVAGFNVTGLVALLVIVAIVPAFDVPNLDKSLMGLANFLTLVLGFVIQMGVSKFSYAQVKGLPVVGKSNSADAEKAAG